METSIFQERVDPMNITAKMVAVIRIFIVN